MKKKSAFLVVLFMILFATACVSRGSGEVVNEQRSVEDFNRVVISGYGEVVLAQSATQSLRIEAEDNIIPLIQITVSDNTLFIEGQGLGKVVPTQPIIIHVNMNEIVGLESSGLSRIDATAIEADHLELTTSVFGGIKIDALTAGQLVINMTEDSSMDIIGEVTAQELDISGNADYRAAKLQSQTAVVNVGGTGTATIWVEELLSGVVNGNGDILYYGSPETELEVISSGKIENRENFDSIEE